MLRVCYILVQIMEVLTGICILHGVYNKQKKNPIWLRGIWGIVFIILIVSYAVNAWDSFISNVFMLLHGILFGLWYCANFKADFLKVFLIEMLYMVNISFLKLPVLILEGIVSGAPLTKINRGGRTILECFWCMILIAAIILLLKKKEFFKYYKSPVQLLISKYTGLMLVITGIQWLLLSYNMWLGM